MLLRLEQSKFNNPFIVNGKHRHTYGMSVIDVDKIKDYIRYINSEPGSAFKFTQKTFHKSDIFLKICEFKFLINLDRKKSEEVNVFKILQNGELFWAFDYHFEQLQ
jgi:hypothetical protein